MKRRRGQRSAGFGFSMMELTLASWETMARRGLMMSRGTCSPAEYRRMVEEKCAAFWETAGLLARSKGAPSASALTGPWRRRARANARRLRRR